MIKSRMFSLYLFLSVLILISLNTFQALALAQENFIVTVGQDKVFTEFNYHPEGWVTDDVNHLPLPSEIWGTSEGNTARAYAKAINSLEGQSGIAYALVGVQFAWDLNRYSWEEVKNWPIDVTLTVNYTISANWELPNGAANAGALTYNPPVWLQYIGHGLNTKGTLSDTATIRYQMTIGSLQELNNIIAMEATAHAHLNKYGGPESIGYSQIIIDNIKIEFSPQIPPQQCVGGHGDQCKGKRRNRTTKKFSGWVSVGSILHDNCCIINFPNGYRCNNGGSNNVCRDEWNKAVSNRLDVYLWWEEEAWGPYVKKGPGDDIALVRPRRSEPQATFETMTTLRLAAPTGTELDISDEEFCESGRFIVKEGTAGICE